MRVTHFSVAIIVMFGSVADWSGGGRSRQLLNNLRDNLIAAEFFRVKSDFGTGIFATKITPTNGHASDGLGTHRSFNEFTSPIIAQIAEEKVAVNVNPAG
jgi:hypothetical protein